MVSIEEDISPASIPIKTHYTWSDKRHSINTKKVNDNLIQFNQSSSYRFERTTEEFDIDSQIKTINLKIRYTDPDYHCCSLGIAWENDLIGDKVQYYFEKSIIYSSHFPNVFFDYNIIPYQYFKVKDNDIVSINFDSSKMSLSYEHNGENLGELNLLNKIIDNNWYFIVGMFVGEIEILD